MSRGRSSVVFLGFAAMATVACPLAAGCMAAESDGMVSDDESAVGVAKLAATTDPDDPPVGHNPFVPNCFWNTGVQQTYRSLASGPLTNSQGQLPNMPNMPSAGSGFNAVLGCRYPALKYLIQCALPENTSVTDPANGLVYHGRFGLASTWRTQALNTTSKEWMTSCLAAHLNNKPVSVALLLEGYRAGFYFDTSLQTTYHERDSITWGNIFDVGPLERPTLHACHFTELDNACTAPAEDELNNRMCDEVEGCNIVLHGDCNSACTWYTNGYWGCATTSNSTLKSTNFRVRLADFSMYDTCGN